jgi:integrase
MFVFDTALANPVVWYTAMPVVATCALVLTAYKWALVGWAFLAPYAPIAAQAPAGYVAFLATWCETFFGTSARDYLLRYFAVHAAPDAVRSLRNLYLNETTWAYRALTHVAESGDAFATWYSSVGWSVVSSAVTNWLPASAVSFGNTATAWASSWTGIVAIVLVCVVGWGPGAFDYTVKKAKGEKLPKRNLLIRLVIWVVGVLPVLFIAWVSPLISLVRGVLMVIGGLVLPPSLDGIRWALTKVASATVQAFYGDENQATVVDGLNTHQQQLRETLNDAAARASDVLQATAATSDATAQALALVGARPFSDRINRFKSEMLVDLFFADRPTTKVCTGTWTHVALNVDDLEQGNPVRFRVEQQKKFSDGGADCVFPIVTLLLLHVRLVDNKEREGYVLTKSGWRQDTAVSSLHAAAPAFVPAASASSAAKTAPAAAAAAKTAPARRADGSAEAAQADRLSGLPEYGLNECWAAAIAVFVGRIVRSLNMPRNASEEAKNFASREWVRSSGSAWISRAVDRVGEPSDAARHAKRMLHRIAMKRGSKASPLADLVSFGPEPPENVQPFAALVFDEERGHWMAATCDKGVWWLHDESSQSLDEAPKAQLFAWPRPTKSDTRTNLDGAASPRPIAVVAENPATVLCACGKQAGQHRGNRNRARCPGCSKLFVADCTGVPSHDRTMLISAPGWLCPGCNAKPRERDQRAAEPVVATAPPTATAAPPAAAAATSAPSTVTAARPAPAAAATVPATTVLALPASARAKAAVPPQQQHGAAPASVVAPTRQSAASVPVPMGPPPPHVQGQGARDFSFQQGDFRGGQQQVPSLPPVFTGEFLLRLQRRDPSSVAKAVESGLSAAVRQRHRNALNNVVESLERNPTWQKENLADLLINYLECKGQRQNWQPQTLHREACNLHGAFANLPLYTTATHPVLLRNSAEWKAALDFWQLRGQQNQPLGQTAACPKDIFNALRNTPEMQTRVALLLMWLTAARPGDILQLKPEHVKLEVNGQLMMTIAAGKGVNFRGVYSVPTLVPKDYIPEMRKYIAEMLRTKSELLFPGSDGLPLKDRMGAMLTALRTANSTLSLRSMRRGALQTMAKAEVPLETLRQFSGHKSNETLLRYLDFGRQHGAGAAAGHAAAAPLAGRP